MKLVCLLIAFVPSVALAQAASPASTPPAPLGKPHSCFEYYPADARANHAEGTTTLAFRISVEGAVSGISLQMSSGNAELDNAAVACVKGWQYAPATQDGKPVEVPWQAMVKWEPGPAPAPIDPAIANAPIKFTEPPRNCARYYPVKAGQLANGDGTTALSFSVFQGKAMDTVVTHSSGNATVDGYAIDCVNSWRFSQVEFDRNPVAVPRRAVIDWKGGS